MRQITVSIIRETDYGKRVLLLLQRRIRKKHSVYEMYYEFEEPIKKLAGHRVLALNRGEKEKILTVKIECTGRRMHMGWLQKQVITQRKSDYNTGSSKK